MYIGFRSTNRVHFSKGGGGGGGDTNVHVYETLKNVSGQTPPCQSGNPANISVVVAPIPNCLKLTLYHVLPVGLPQTTIILSCCSYIIMSYKHHTLDAQSIINFTLFLLCTYRASLP